MTGGSQFFSYCQPITPASSQQPHDEICHLVHHCTEWPKQ
jgi:hypothetical protein